MNIEKLKRLEAERAHLEKRVGELVEFASSPEFREAPLPIRHLIYEQTALLYAAANKITNRISKAL